MGDTTDKTKVPISGLQTAGIAAMAAIIGAAVSAWFPYLSRDRELDIRLVEIGVGILRADPEKSGVSAARQWAITAIEKNSKIVFTPKDKELLLNKPLQYKDVDYAYPSGNDWYDLSPGYSGTKPDAARRPPQPQQ